MFVTTALMLPKSNFWSPKCCFLYKYAPLIQPLQVAGGLKDKSQQESVIKVETFF